MQGKRKSGGEKKLFLFFFLRFSIFICNFVAVNSSREKKSPLIHEIISIIALQFANVSNFPYLCRAKRDKELKNLF